MSRAAKKGANRRADLGWYQACRFTLDGMQNGTPGAHCETHGTAKMTHRRLSARLRTTALGALVFALLAPLSAAQENLFARDRYTSVTERAQPDFDPEPIRLGRFLARPVLDTGLAYQTNIFAAASGEVADVIATLAPSVGLVSDWSRHQLAFDARVEHREYLDEGDESTTGYGVAGRGRVDVTSRFNLTGGLRAEKAFEPRSATANLPQAAEPTEFDRTGAEVGANYTAGRIQLRGRISADNYDYSDVALRTGGTADQDFRDRDETQLVARAAFAPQRDWAVFAEARLIERDYDGAGGANRDSTGTVFQVGTDFELNALLRGEVAVGYLQTEFDSGAFADIDGLSLDGRVQWFVSQLTTLTGTATRTVVDPGLAGAAAAVLTGVDLRADHELRRNWLVFGEAGLANTDFEGFNREDDRAQIGVGTLWKINKRAWLEAAYRYTNQDSQVQEFSDNRLTVSLKLRP